MLAAQIRLRPLCIPPAQTADQIGNLPCDRVHVARPCQIEEPNIVGAVVEVADYRDHLGVVRQRDDALEQVLEEERVGGRLTVGRKGARTVAIAEVRDGLLQSRQAEGGEVLLDRMPQQEECQVVEIPDLGEAEGLGGEPLRSEEHQSELQYLRRNSYAVIC